MLRLVKLTKLTRMLKLSQYAHYAPHHTRSRHALFLTRATRLAQVPRICRDGGQVQPRLSARLPAVPLDDDLVPLVCMHLVAGRRL